ncbi:MAG: diguanylate cyclase [Nitrospirae bacterium]|nr:diguanylate cyclase [Nitrospirota bacterium]
MPKTPDWVGAIREIMGGLEWPASPEKAVRSSLDILSRALKAQAAVGFLSDRTNEGMVSMASCGNVRAESFTSIRLDDETKAFLLRPEFQLLHRGAAVSGNGVEGFLHLAPSLGFPSASGGLVLLPLTWEGNLRGLLVFDLAPGSGRRGSAGSRSSALDEGSLRLAGQVIALGLSIRLLARRDPTSQLFDDAVFRDVLRREVKRAMRYKRTLSVIVAAPDNVESCVAGLGEQSPEGVIRALARLVEANLREYDVACSGGAGVFRLFLPEADKATALRAAKKLSGLIAEDPAFGRKKNRLVVSFGTATLPDDAATTSSLIRRADEALSLARAEGGGVRGFGEGG